MKRIALVVLLICFVCIKSYAADGVPTTSGNEYGISYKDANFLNTKSVTGTSTYIYDDSGNSGVNDGWVDVTGLNNGTIVLDVPVFNSGTITFRIESIVGSSTLHGEVVTKHFTAATTIGFVIPISEKLNKIRVGSIVTGDTGSGTVSASGHFESN